jgi:alpha-1,3-mannosyltransferase
VQGAGCGGNIAAQPLPFAIALCTYFSEATFYPGAVISQLFPGRSSSALFTAMAMSRSLRPLLQAVALVAAGYMLFSFEFGGSLSQITPIVPGSWYPSASSPTTASATPALKKGNATLYEQAPPYIHAIMDPSDTTFPRLVCPKPNLERYAYLGSSESSAAQLPNYYFALDLHQTVQLLPRLLGSIVETMRFLGPQNCVLSIVEGRSDDGTYEVLDGLRSSMELIGIHYIFQTSDINPSGQGQDRIEALAALRNLAVQDLSAHPDSYDADTTVIFSNDIAPCMEDILEITHQRKALGADQTCAMD